MIDWLWIGGTGRCGTSLLRDVLGMHPEVYAIPDETNPSPESDEFWNSWLRGYGKMHLSKALSLGAKMIVEKTPRNALVADSLVERIEALPDVKRARYVHMTRDPVAATEAIRRFGRYPMPKMGKLPYSDDAIRLWVEWVNWTGQQSTKTITVSLELLLQYPADELSKLGLEATPEQLHYIKVNRRD